MARDAPLRANILVSERREAIRKAFILGRPKNAMLGLQASTPASSIARTSKRRRSMDRPDYLTEAQIIEAKARIAAKRKAKPGRNDEAPAGQPNWTVALIRASGI